MTPERIDHSRLPKRALLVAAAISLAACIPSAEATASSASIVYAFQGGTDGQNPTTLIDIGGTLYGETAYGGGSNNTGCNNGPPIGCGTVFSVTLSGTEKVLYGFQGGSDGYDPRGLMLAGKALIGYSSGVIFSITTSGTFNVLSGAFNPSWSNNLPPLIKIGKTYYGISQGTLGATNCGNNACGYIFAVTL